eukprot:6174324-Pleurochrysis_carterae.AAC.1
MLVDRCTPSVKKRVLPKSAPFCAAQGHARVCVRALHAGVCAREYLSVCVCFEQHVNPAVRVREIACACVGARARVHVYPPAPARARACSCLRPDAGSSSAPRS